MSTFAPRAEVRISGVTLAADLAQQLISVSVDTDLDLAGSFSLVLHNRDNTLLDSALLDLGKTVEIHLGYGNDLVPAFLGEIAAVEPSFPADGPPTVHVTGYDKSYRMRHAQPEPTDYTLTNHSIIAAQLAAENGLIPVVDPTPGIEKHVVQSENDMAFLKSLADQHWFDVYVEWDRLHFQLPRPQTAAHVLEWGRNLTSFSPRISAAGAAGLQVVRGYNQELAQTIYVAAAAADLDPDNLLERLGSSALDIVTSLTRQGIRKQTVTSPLQALELARAILATLLEGMYEGTGQCIGIPDLTAGKYVQIAGVGKRFSGTFRARRVSHRLDGAGFSTEFGITRRGRTSLLGQLRQQTVTEPQPDVPEKFYGVLLAEVVDDSELTAVPPEVPIGRVRVRYPGLSGTMLSGWVPVLRPLTGSDAGFYALPQPGDQVLVGFEHGDLGQPYVLGALWSVTSRPPVTLGTGDIVLKDRAGSSITLSPVDGSVSVHAAGNLTLAATGTVTLQAAAGSTSITMSATGVDIT